jgi:hypothetical protein
MVRKFGTVTRKTSPESGEVSMRKTIAVGGVGIGKPRLDGELGLEEPDVRHESSVSSEPDLRELT